MRGRVAVLRILSVGCASGEEPYSIAIVGRRIRPTPDGSASIRRIDLNPAMMRKAAAGALSAWALRDTPPPIRDHWFRPVAAISRSTRRSGRGPVRRHNLAEDDSSCGEPAVRRHLLPQPADVLDPGGGRHVVAPMTAALVPGGYLFLGHTETLAPPLRALSSGTRTRRSTTSASDQAAVPPARERCPGPLPRPRPAPAAACR